MWRGLGVLSATIQIGVEWVNILEVNEVSVSLTYKAVMMPLRPIDPRQEIKTL